MGNSKWEVGNGKLEIRVKRQEAGDEELDIGGRN